MAARNGTKDILSSPQGMPAKLRPLQGCSMCLLASFSPQGPFEIPCTKIFIQTAEVCTERPHTHVLDTLTPVALPHLVLPTWRPELQPQPAVPLDPATKWRLLLIAGSSGQTTYIQQPPLLPMPKGHKCPLKELMGCRWAICKFLS